MTSVLKSAQRVALFGGSFDPPHEGHLGIARAARDALDLDLVLFAPTGAQPLKPSGASASYQDRLVMTELAIRGESGFDVSPLDAPNPDGAPNYTADALERLREEMNSSACLFFLLGADAFLSLHQWHRASEIPFLAKLIVAARPGQTVDDLQSHLPTGISLKLRADGARPTDQLAVQEFMVRDAFGGQNSLHLLPALRFDVSASEIRAAVHQAHSNSTSMNSDSRLESNALLPDSVRTYIREHELYR